MFLGHDLSSFSHTFKVTSIIETPNERPLSSHHAIFCARCQQTYPLDEVDLMVLLFTISYTHSFGVTYFYVGVSLL